MPQTAPDDRRLFARALAAYWRRAESDGYNPDQPSAPEIVMDGGNTYVVLRNAKGLLAVYRVRNDGALKRLRRIPRTITE